MRTRGIITSASVATVMAASTLMAVTAAPAQAAWQSCDLSVKVRELDERYPGSNIVVYRKGNLGSYRVRDVVAEGGTRQEDCQGKVQADLSREVVDYRWLVFTGGGDFSLGEDDDGGFRNWAFSGFVEQDEKQLEFSPR